MTAIGPVPASHLVSGDGVVSNHDFAAVICVKNPSALAIDELASLSSMNTASFEPKLVGSFQFRYPWVGKSPPTLMGVAGSDELVSSTR